MPQPGFPPQPGSPQFGYAPSYSAENPFSSRATTVLVLAIIGGIFCGICAPIAWVMGNTVKKEATAAGWPEPGTNQAGRIIGIIVTALYALGIALFVLAVAVGIAAG